MLLETELKASTERWRLAETLSHELYQLFHEHQPPLKPDELAFELYNTIITKRGRPAIVIWDTDEPGTVRAKVEGLANAEPRPLDERTEACLAAMMARVHELCPNRTVAEYAVKELYVQTRCYEHIGLTKHGFIFLKGWPMEMLDTNLVRFFKKTYKELKEEQTKTPWTVELYEGSAPGETTLCIRCKQRKAVHFDKTANNAYSIDSCCGSPECCRIGKERNL